MRDFGEGRGGRTKRNSNSIDVSHMYIICTLESGAREDDLKVVSSYYAMSRAMRTFKRGRNS